MAKNKSVRHADPRKARNETSAPSSEAGSKRNERMETSADMQKK